MSKSTPSPSLNRSNLVLLFRGRVTSRVSAALEPVPAKALAILRPPLRRSISTGV